MTSFFFLTQRSKSSPTAHKPSLHTSFNREVHKAKGLSYSRCRLLLFIYLFIFSGNEIAKLKLKQSRPQSFVPLYQRSENESSGSIHFQITMEITEFCISGFTAQCAICIYTVYGACLKWMLPELSFSDHWSRGTKLGERD